MQVDQAELAEVCSQILDRITDGDLEAIEQSKTQSEFANNCFRVLLDQNRRDLVQYWRIYRLFDQVGESEMLEKLKGLRSRSSDAIRGMIADCGTASDAIRLKGHIVNGFRWFASVVSIDECLIAAVTIELNTPAESEAKVVTALAAIEVFIDGLPCEGDKERHDTTQQAIPDEHRTESMTIKERAAECFRNVDWSADHKAKVLRKMMDNCEIRFEQVNPPSGRRWYFDNRDT